MADAPADPTFETVDWSRYEASGYVVGRTTLAFAAAVTVLVAAFLYHLYLLPPGAILAFGIAPGPIDWLAAFSVVLLSFYVLVPLVRHRGLTRHYWRQLRARPPALAALGYLLAFATLGLVGPELLGPPGIAPIAIDGLEYGPPPGHPPFWSSVPNDADLIYCATEVVDGRCQGTLVHPFGTTPDGQDVLALVVWGMRLALEVAVITAAILVPIATIVGTVAAYFGGRVDEFVVRYVDLQGAIPAFIAYFLVQYLIGPSLVALIVLFGVLDWDRLARRVRGDARRTREAGFVRAAESAGARPADVIRRHLVPNVSTTIASGLAIQIPFVVIMEATFSYIGIVQTEVPSWGYSISLGLSSQGGDAWWAYAFPLAALLLTIVAMNVLGSALHDVIEPRERGPQG